MKLLIVGLGGFIGSILRYTLDGWVQRPSNDFPFGTLAVNVLGCFLIGLLLGLVESRALFGEEMRLFLVTGLLGALTTFSTFGYQTFALGRDGEVALAVLNVVAQLVLGLVAVWLGAWIAR